MINFKSFVTAIHDAIMGSNEALMEKNLGLLDKYFDKQNVQVPDGKGGTKTKEELVPKTVTLNYPCVDENYHEDDDTKNNFSVESAPIEVPLITLVPLSMTKIEKATLKAEFELEVVDGDLELNFVNKKTTGLFGKKPKTTRGTLEIVLSPQESSEGLSLLVDSYENFLKQQMP